jgi:hypothetical protein
VGGGVGGKEGEREGVHGGGREGGREWVGETKGRQGSVYCVPTTIWVCTGVFVLITQITQLLFYCT